MNLSRLGFFAFAAILAVCDIALSRAIGTAALIAAAVGCVLGLPLGILYAEPAARSQAVRGARAPDRAAVVLATIFGTTLLPALAIAFGLVDWLLIGAAAIGGAIATSLLYTALRSNTMEVVETARRERDLARNRHTR
jgi:hypothetical protein